MALNKITKFIPKNISILASFVVALTAELLPMWIAAALLLFYGVWRGLSFFWINGEFYLYAVVFSAQAIYLFMKYISTYNDAKNAKVIFMIAISIIVLILSSIYYAASITSTLISIDPQPNSIFIGFSSIALLLSATIFLFGGHVYSSKTGVDVSKISHKQTDKIVKDI